jgi:hypothetical protein
VMSIMSLSSIQLKFITNHSLIFRHLIGKSVNCQLYNIMNTGNITDRMIENLLTSDMLFFYLRWS